MHFLKTLFWVVIAVLLAIVASRNWHNVTLNLWGDLQADIKAPVLLAFTFLLGFLPTYLLLRGRIWSLRRRLEYHEQQALASTPRAQEPVDQEQP